MPGWCLWKQDCYSPTPPEGLLCLQGKCKILQEKGTGFWRCSTKLNQIAEVERPSVRPCRALRMLPSLQDLRTAPSKFWLFFPPWGHVSEGKGAKQQLSGDESYRMRAKACPHVLVCMGEIETFAYLQLCASRRERGRGGGERLESRKPARRVV